MFKCSGKRRWHRVHDGAQEKRRREDSISDKTRLLSPHHQPEVEHRVEADFAKSHPDLVDLPPPPTRSHGYLSDVPTEVGHLHDSLTCVRVPVSAYRHVKKDRRRLEPWISDMDGCASDCRPHQTEEDVPFVTSSLLANDPSDGFRNREKSLKGLVVPPGGGQSWRGFKQLLRKQFMPFTTSLGSEDGREEMQHLRQKRVEGADANVLAAKTNLVELRKMDAKIQDRIHKSAFLASSKKLKAKENIDLGNKRNLGINKELTDCTKVESRLQTKSYKVNQKLPSQLKENTIFRKLINRTQKERPAVPLATQWTEEPTF